MIRILAKLILTFIVLVWVLLALVEVYPDQVKKAEAVVWIEVVEPIQNFIADMKSKLDKARDKDYQRDIEDIVNDEIVQ